MLHINDFDMPSKEGEVPERHRGRHFQIEYSLATNKYTIKDLGKGFGVFARLDHPQAILTND
jgi:hypothetical protein